MRISIAIAALLLSGSAYAGAPETVTLNVQNMSCAACPITIKKALEQVPGVRNVKIDFEKKTATVRLDPDHVNVASLIKATADAGFPSAVKK